MTLPASVFLEFFEFSAQGAEPSALVDVVLPVAAGDEEERHWHCPRQGADLTKDDVTDGPQKQRGSLDNNGEDVNDVGQKGPSVLIFSEK
jgi:hypothetical protein